MQCPQCQSQDVYRCSVAHAQGSTTTHTSGSSSGIDHLSGGQQVTANRNISTSSQSTTAFAERCAPPTSSLANAVIFSVIALVVLLVCDRPDNALLTMIAGIAMAALGVGVVWTILAACLRPRYRAALERWRKTWVCVRCGHFFLGEA